MNSKIRSTLWIALIIIIWFTVGFIVAKRMYAEEMTPIEQAPYLIEEVEVIPFVQANISITAPDKEIMNLVTDSNVVSLEFVATDATTCWYDLGGSETFQLPGCANTTLNLEYDKDYVLNIWATNGTETDPSQAGLDSVWFKTPLAPVETSSGSSTGTCVDLSMPCGLNIIELITPEVQTDPEVLGVAKFMFTEDMSYGSKGNEVVELQKVVGVKDDGIFGPITDKAVKVYQTLKGLVADGIVGPLTRGELNK